MKQKHYWWHFSESKNDGRPEDWMLFLSKADSPSWGTLCRTDRMNEWKFTIHTHSMYITCLIAGETKRGAMAKCVRILKSLNKGFKENE